MKNKLNQQSLLALSIRQEAAELERSGAALHAASKWQQAAFACQDFNEREWCERRAAFCQTRFMKKSA
ncbi:ANR family transcriptional regulator [Shewanella xiamenensis]|uniref:ANR family transcriptional regulator n=1 Tax=Shewanella xiamenensis TaxID=332186 RepID=UPI0008497526|nr:ANR family transcriptional regulator [Shewanella xiamenensis]ODR86723.1 hypothetical protein ABT47_16135 [Shewanella xiamenensis]